MLAIIFLIPLSQDHELIILLSRVKKACFLVIAGKFISLSLENKRQISRDNEIIIAY